MATEMDMATLQPLSMNRTRVLDPPSFLTVPIKNEIPVRVDMVWHPS